MRDQKILNLHVSTGDEVAEIFVIDSRFERVAKHSGRIAKFQLPEGLYSVKVKVGYECLEKPVALLDEDQRVNFVPLAFESAAPVDGSSKTHEYQIDNAIAHSKKVHVRRGNGGQFYIFVRTWTSHTISHDPKFRKRNPAVGLTLWTYGGNMLLDIAATSDWTSRPDEDSWAACNIELDPGGYLLCLDTKKGDKLYFPIFISQGWQTQLYCLLRDYGLEELPDMRADLLNASILMAETGQGFNFPSRGFHEGPNFRLSELARQALLSDRSHLASNIVHEALKEKFRNPMLGIYAAHLLLAGENKDPLLLKEVIHNLRNMLPSHPDVEAIALKAGQGDHNYTFECPPLLRRSWSFILEASVHDSNLIREHSWVSHFTGTFWGESLWFIADGEENAMYDASLLEQLQKLSTIYSNALKPSAQNFPSEMMVENEELLHRGIDLPNMMEPIGQNIQNEEMAYFVQSLGVPRHKVESLIKMNNSGSAMNSSFTEVPV